MWYGGPSWHVIECFFFLIKSIGILDIKKTRKRISQSPLKFVLEYPESNKRGTSISSRKVERETIFRDIETIDYKSSSMVSRVSIWTQ